MLCVGASACSRGLCALKLEDVPGLAPLPSYAAAENFEPNERQRSTAAGDSSLHFWEEQRRLKALGLPNKLADEIAVLLQHDDDGRPDDSL